MSKHVFFSAVFVVASIYSGNTQIDNNSDLFVEFKKRDSIFFDRAYNQCDMVYLENHISDNLKFYHDQGGFQDKKTFLENVRKYICSNSDKKPIRQVDPSSLEVFPLYNNGILYGVIQKGMHHFYLREKDKEDVWTSTAKFTSVWILENKIWKIHEVLSYNHQSLEFERPKNELEQILIDSKVPALGIGEIENGKLTKVEVYGTLDKNTTAPYNAIFKVASLTKPIVSLITLKLIDQGVLDLDEPLYKYWIDPEIEDDLRHKMLTPRVVLSHQTGFPNWRYLTDSNKLTFEFDPGTKHQYSGEGFEYLRRALESKLDKSIEELANEFLFDPLQMTDTHFWWDSKLDQNRYAQNYDENGEKLETTKYFNANAAANLLTTVEDYGKFIAYVINGADLSKNLYQEMIKQQVKLKERDYFGLGWEILTDFSNNEFALLHSGRDPGVSSLAVWFPKSKNGYVVFLNGSNVKSIYKELLTKRLYLGRDLWNKR